MRTFKYRWSSALGTSLACHVVALGLITGFMLLFPASPVNKGPIEVDLVTMSGGGGGGGGGNGGETPQEEKLPEIKEAKATPTAPPPVKTEPDPEAENDVHEVAPKAAEDIDHETSSSTSSSSSSSEGSTSSGTGGGSGGGNGTGNGPGDGSGEGPGSGSGSGGGNGSGYGSGNGDGAGPGDGPTDSEILQPQTLSQPKPPYPESCRKANITGSTVVGLTISTDGTVTSTWVIASSGNSDLDAAATQGVYRWQFVPAKQNGVPIMCNTKVTINFNLN